jgi:hypothetical protein
MPRSLPISSTTLPDAELEASNCAHLVLNTYTISMMTHRNEPKAFEAAIEHGGSVIRRQLKPRLRAP